MSANETVKLYQVEPDGFSYLRRTYETARLTTHIDCPQCGARAGQECLPQGSAIHQARWVHVVLGKSSGGVIENRRVRRHTPEELEFWKGYDEL